MRPPEETPNGPLHSSGSTFTVLVFSKTQGYRHSSISAGVLALEELAKASESSLIPFHIHATEDAIVFNPVAQNYPGPKPPPLTYRVIVFLQSSGEFLDNEAQLSALEGFVQGGGGVVGIHCASTGLPSSTFYGSLIGAVFTDHPDPQKGTVVVEAPSHPILSGTAVPESTVKRAVAVSTPGNLTAKDNVATQFEWFDEWYNFKANPRAAGAHVLLTVKEATYKGGTMGEDHPVAWCQDRQDSRSFYTALGHFDDAYRDPRFMRIIRNAIMWTARVSI
ncbi:class I glutamine amidotransferase-like protein [Cryphonectria parasitica EP155]|uniref:Class I glutamine amidotransferase-like protein n=1 Tax=Cryphonectria parasitica (strain ATCC 38755 / EP155) TaxID=660469 RepID=A0A9P5CK47_CRYP1|nr:class I glutamine amidotransferase-like protein [Cryphonectria parasitica EP155]KAF3760370.1 class I glutamine amidotransferase-like protein [Cryphonectria parasitica EP155]